jgi:hypothetical protein
MKSSDVLSNAMHTLRERQRTFGDATSVYARGAVIATALRDSNTNTYDVVVSEISNKFSRLSQNRMHIETWVELCLDVAVAAEVAMTLGIVNPAVTMANFKDDVARELEAQIAEEAKHMAQSISNMDRS